MKINRFILLFYFLLTGFYLFSQPSEYKNDLRPPMDIPMRFSGNFGEFRTSHFHSGVDLKTKGKEGVEVHASDDAYVSRILVSKDGYGNAVYLTHPNGLLTVYGHLSSFNKEISAYIRRMQYQQESWFVNVYLPKNLITVKRGEVIARSGNSGSSFGPHLHYEVRDADSEDIINPLHYLEIKDNIRPKATALYIYQLNNMYRFYDEQPIELKLKKRNEDFYLAKDTIKLEGKVGFGLDMVDFIPGSWNRCGLYSMRMYVNNNLSYFLKMDRFSFENSSSINLLKDVRMAALAPSKIYKTWLPTVCSFNGLKIIKNRGVLNLKKDSIYNLKFEVNDFAGNQFKLAFVVKANSFKRKDQPSYKECRLYARDDNKVSCEEMTLSINSGDLFANVDVDTLIFRTNNPLFYKSKIYRFGKEYVPLKRKVKLSIKTHSPLANKMFFVSVGSSGRLSFIGGSYKNGLLSTQLRRLGDFAVCVDTVAPSVRPRKTYSRNWLKKFSVLRFNVRDKHTGICSYRAELGGRWVLAKYDRRTSQIICYIERGRFPKKDSEFSLEVTDFCGNVKKYTRIFSL